MHQVLPTANDLFATRSNNILAQFVSPVPDPLVWAVNALSLSWEDPDPYAFPLVAMLGRVVVKTTGVPFEKIVLGWPNMPWFWDLVAMSSQIPLCLPNLLTHLLSQTPHGNLLTLHALLLEPQPSKTKASVRQF